MIKNYISKQSGLTLIELLAALAISSIVIGLISGVLIQTIKSYNTTMSHINLRQEANIIITQIRQDHQEGKQVCYNDLITNHNLSSNGILIGNETINLENQCTSTALDPAKDLPVQFTLAETKGNSQFKLDTVIEGIKNLSNTLTIANPSSVNEFYNYILNTNAFVYGTQFAFSGGLVNGPGATMVINGNLNSSQINGGSNINVSNIYIDGTADLESGSQYGSSTNPGNIYVNGDLTLGSYQDVYGNVYVNGNLNIKSSSTIEGNVYVKGNVTLGNTPTIVGNAKIYYTGTLTYPNNYDKKNQILPKLIYTSAVSDFTMPVNHTLQLKDPQWFTGHGYNTTIQPNDMKIYADNININSYYDSNLQKYIDTFTNAILVSNGDININGGSLKMSGMLIAPNGKVTFNGSSFQGIVIAKDGFYVTSGGSDVTFLPINTFIANSDDFPLQ